MNGSIVHLMKKHSKLETNTEIQNKNKWNWEPKRNPNSKIWIP